MNCYFLRHGVAVDAQEWHGSDDDRPLTREGYKRMEREAKGVADLVSGVDVIVTSPILRARQTAEIVAERLPFAAFVDDRRVARGFNAAAVRAIVGERGEPSSLLFVGHEPTMSAAVGALIGGAQIELKKGAFACVELPASVASAGVLTYLIPPKVLAALH